MCQGRLFQSLRAAAPKARPPLVFSLVLGTSSNSWLADRSALAGVWKCSSSARCWGASPLRGLKTNKILKSILNCAGSQWSEANAGVMWSHVCLHQRPLHSILTSVMKLVEPVEFSYIAHWLSFSSGVHSGAGPPSASEPNLLWQWDKTQTLPAAAGAASVYRLLEGCVAEAESQVSLLQLPLTLKWF